MYTVVSMSRLVLPWRPTHTEIHEHPPFRKTTNYTTGWPVLLWRKIWSFNVKWSSFLVKLLQDGTERKFLDQFEFHSCNTNDVYYFKWIQKQNSDRYCESCKYSTEITKTKWVWVSTVCARDCDQHKKDWKNNFLGLFIKAIIKLTQKF